MAKLSGVLWVGWLVAGCGSSGGGGGGGPGLVKTDMIGPAGGTIALAGVGSLKFPAGAFPTATQVTIRTTADPATAALYTETTGIFELGPRASYEVRIDVGRVPPAQPLAIELTIPDDFDGAARVLIEQPGASEEDALPQFEALEATTSAGSVKLTLAPEYLTSNLAPDGGFETVLTLAQPGQQTTLPPGFPGTMTFPLGTGSCPVKGFAAPLKSISVNSPFDPNRKIWLKRPNLPEVACTTADECPDDARHPKECRNSLCRYLWVGHPGVDYAAQPGDKLFAGGVGTVIESRRSDSFGETVVISVPGTGAIRYAHMKTRTVVVGQAVTCGQDIGESDTTGVVNGPHLHLELAPAGGVKIDPHPCVSVCPSWNGTASEEAILTDPVAGGSLNRRITATVVWKEMPGPFGSVFEATGTAALSGSGVEAGCQVTITGGPVQISGTLQFFPTTPPMYMAQGSYLPNNEICYEHTACPMGGSFTTCGTPPPWVSTGIQPYDPMVKTISGTSGGDGITYTWSFMRTP